MSVHPSTPTFPWGAYDEQLASDAAEMWCRVVNAIDDDPIHRVVVIDDGGHATATVPSEILDRFPTVAIEQTSSGLRNGRAARLPVVAVAVAAAKTLLEPVLIRDAVFARALTIAERRSSAVMGVVGLGHIGSSIAEGLRAAGHRVLGFDSGMPVRRQNLAVEECGSVAELFARADVVWGCVGADVFSDAPNATPISNAELISCSSGDSEFRTLLSRLNAEPGADTLARTADLRLGIDGHTVTIRRGGFPINFDGGTESVPGIDIQLTRGLLFGGVLQAVDEPLTPGLIALSAGTQHLAVREWLQANPAAAGRYPTALIEQFGDEQWIAERFGTIVCELRDRTDCGNWLGTADDADAGRQELVLPVQAVFVIGRGISLEMLRETLPISTVTALVPHSTASVYRNRMSTRDQGHDGRTRPMRSRLS